MLRDHLAGRDVTVLVEDPILETGGGLRAARSALGGGPVLTLNPDGAFGGPNPLAALRDAWGDDTAEALLLVAPAERAGRRAGDFSLAEDGRLTRGGEWAYIGAQVIATEALDAIDDTVFSLNVAWDAMIERGTLQGLPYEGRWADIGTPEAIPAAEALLEGRDVLGD